MPGSLFDSNVWVALTFQNHPFHETARGSLRDRTPDAPALFCRSTEQSFLRLASAPTLLARYGCDGCDGLTNHDALGFLEGFYQLPNVIFAEEIAATRERWFALADRGTASPKLWMDAYLAAFAITGNWRLVTLDKDFLQFESHGLELDLLGSRSW